MARIGPSGSRSSRCGPVTKSSATCGDPPTAQVRRRQGAATGGQRACTFGRGHVRATVHARRREGRREWRARVRRDLDGVEDEKGVEQPEGEAALHLQGREGGHHCEGGRGHTTVRWGKGEAALHLRPPGGRGEAGVGRVPRQRHQRQRGDARPADEQHAAVVRPRHGATPRAVAARQRQRPPPPPRLLPLRCRAPGSAAGAVGAVAAAQQVRARRVDGRRLVGAGSGARSHEDFPSASLALDAASAGRQPSRRCAARRAASTTTIDDVGGAQERGAPRLERGATAPRQV